MSRARAGPQVCTVHHAFQRNFPHWRPLFSQHRRKRQDVFAFFEGCCIGDRDIDVRLTLETERRCDRIGARRLAGRGQRWRGRASHHRKRTGSLGAQGTLATREGRDPGSKQACERYMPPRHSLFPPATIKLTHSSAHLILALHEVPRFATFRNVTCGSKKCLAFRATVNPSKSSACQHNRLAQPCSNVDDSEYTLREVKAKRTDEFQNSRSRAEAFAIYLADGARDGKTHSSNGTACPYSGSMSLVAHSEPSRQRTRAGTSWNWRAAVAGGAYTAGFAWCAAATASSRHALYSSSAHSVDHSDISGNSNAYLAASGRYAERFAHATCLCVHVLWFRLASVLERQRHGQQLLRGASGCRECLPYFSVQSDASNGKYSHSGLCLFPHADTARGNDSGCSWIAEPKCRPGRSERFCAFAKPTGASFHSSLCPVCVQLEHFFASAGAWPVFM